MGNSGCLTLLAFGMRIFTIGLQGKYVGVAPIKGAIFYLARGPTGQCVRCRWSDLFTWCFRVQRCVELRSIYGGVKC